MRLTLFFLCASVLVMAATARANNTGIFGNSGRDAEGDTCTQCHLGENGIAPTIAVSGLEGPLTAGGFADFTITLKTSDPAGGIAAAACPGRCAGLNAAVDTGAGTFVIPDGSIVQTNTARDEISHLAKSPFVNGEVSYRLVITGLTQGAHTLFVAGNDVDGQANTGDRVSTVAQPFTVGPPATGAPEPPPGCASVRAAPAALALLLVALSFSRRGRGTSSTPASAKMPSG